MANPAIAEIAFHEEAEPGLCGSSKSTTVADSVDSRIPLAMPCTTRERISVAALSACQNRNMLMASTTNAAQMTGRRPMWSERAPAVSSAASNATA